MSNTDISNSGIDQGGPTELQSNTEKDIKND